SVNWYSSYISEVLVLVLSDSWKNTPIVALILLAGMTGISKELYSAAAVDGAGPIRRFVHVTLPNLRNFILIALVIRGISEFNIFVLPLVLVQYNPNLLSTLAFQFYSTSSINYSYAASTVLLTLVLVFALIAVKLRKER
ncbi:sugar ABC transporter permease, partial [Candidatus Bathyarchaeota archaeon]|nr:sugar ABC transporter permease [Candidatus Bathyarchaeota archaeon]